MPLPGNNQGIFYAPRFHIYLQFRGFPSLSQPIRPPPADPEMYTPIPWPIPPMGGSEPGGGWGDVQIPQLDDLFFQIGDVAVQLGEEGPDFRCLALTQQDIRTDLDRGQRVVELVAH